MFEPFLKTDIGASYRTIITHSFRRANDHLTSIHPQHAIPYALIAKSQPVSAGSANSGIYLKILAGIGQDQDREMTVDDFARRYSGRAINLTVQAKLVDASQTLQLLGGLAYDECEATTEVCAVTSVTNLLGSKDLTYTVINGESAIAANALFGVIQRETRRISLSCPAAARATPVTVYVFGRRYQDNADVPLASFTSGSGVGGGTYQLVDINPGEYKQLYYRVPLMTTGSGLGKLYIWEEIRTED